MEKIVAKALLEIKAVFFRPDEPFTWASGIKSPVYCDNRLILTAPEQRKIVEQAIADKVKEVYPECEVLMGTSTAGIAQAGTLSELSYAWAMKRLILAYRVPRAKRSSLQFTDWSAVVADKRLDDKIRYPELSDDQIFGVDTARDVISLLTEKMPYYTKRPERVGKR